MADMTTGGTALTFGDRLSVAFVRHGHLCVGIDPHPGLLQAWGLPLSAAGVREFGLAVVNAAAGAIGIVKPQIAFFERFGSAGYAALEDVIAEARRAGLIVIADVKRGDIGSTMEGYAAAWLDNGSPLEVDAITVSPYLGVSSLESTFARAHESGKGVFVLAATSNSEAKGVQTSTSSDQRTLARSVVNHVARWNRVNDSLGHLGSVGVVIGATVSLPEYDMTTELLQSASLPLLVPGFGHQGVAVSEWRNILGAAASNAIVSVSRSVLSAGQSGLADALIQTAERVRE